MELIRVFFCGTVALALFGEHMEDHRTGKLFGLAQKIDQALYVMAVDRADILKAHVVEHI